MDKSQIASAIEYIKTNLTIAYYFNEVIVKDNYRIYGNYVDFFITPVIICPLHYETKGSFRYFPATNSYSCYGCNSGGDVIKLHQEYMRINYSEISFISAVEFLYALAHGSTPEYNKQIFKQAVNKPDVKITNLEKNKALIKMNEYFKIITKPELTSEEKLLALRHMYDYKETMEFGVESYSEATIRLDERVKNLINKKGY